MFVFYVIKNDLIVDIEYHQEICLLNFVVEELSGLIAHPSIFVINDSMSA